jgi:Xaa-Pro dipeptidase
MWGCVRRTHPHIDLYLPVNYIFLERNLLNLTSIYPSRLSQLKTTLKKNGLDAMVFNPGPSLHYLTGLHFHLSERPVVFIVPVQGEPALILPQLEALKLQDASFALQSYTYGEVPSQWPASFEDALQSTQLQTAKIGVEPQTLRLLEYRLLEKAAPQAAFLPANESIAALRMHKSADEINAMQEAARIAQDALQAALPVIKIGASEKEIAAELVSQLLAFGSDPRLPFFPIVSGGPNSANPHAAPSDRRLSAGDLLVIDWGANVNGYFSDITRTFAIGEVDPEYRLIAEIVLKANQAGHAAARPGIPIGEVDRAARGIIEEAGYGAYFTHRTGHGLGLEGHEEPYVRDDNQMILLPGMTFTIEPGIYLPNRNGVRIEDDIVITTNGCQSLTDLPRELVTLQ